MRAIAAVGTVLFLGRQALTVQVSDPLAPLPNVTPPEEKPLSFHFSPPSQEWGGGLVALSSGSLEDWRLFAQIVETEEDGNFTAIHDSWKGRTGPKPENCQFRDSETGEIIPGVNAVTSFRWGHGTANCSFPDGRFKEIMAFVSQYNDTVSYYERGARDTWVQCSDFVPEPWTDTKPRAYPFSALEAENVIQPVGIALHSRLTPVAVTCDEPPSPSLGPGEKAGIGLGVAAAGALATAAACYAARKRNAAARVRAESGATINPV